MTDTNKRYCKQCQSLIQHPMFMIAPVSLKDKSNNNGVEKVLIAARITCTCSEDIRVESDVNAADLSNLKPEIRRLIYERISSQKNNLPVIDPERINECDCVMFVTGFSKSKFANWMALDLLELDQFYSYIEEKIIRIEEIRI